MTRDQARALLSSSEAHERLKAARFFAKHALPDDHELVVTAHAKESISWIRRALFAAVQLSRNHFPKVPQNIEEDDEGEINVGDVHAQAVEETTNAILHEVRPAVGLIKAFAEKEIGENFSQSRTKFEIERLSSILQSIDLLGRAASQAVPKEFDLAMLIEEISRSTTHTSPVPMFFAGPKPFLVIGDSHLLGIAYANGLRNAIESTERLGVLKDAKVVVSWGKTDIDYWLSILDSGTGIVGSTEAVFEMGTTSKEGHLGMGLALARRAIQSMRGSLKLTPRKERGMQFLISWPGPGMTDESVSR